MKRALIFGASGQDGIYMTELCKKQGIIPICISRSNAEYTESVTNQEFVQHIIIEQQPDYIFHFAANSTTRYDALFENHETISTGTLFILDAVYKYSKHSKVLITGSGVQFKNEGLPISENSEFEAWNAYAIARIQSVYAARFFRNLGIKTYVAYLFHHESPYRKPDHVSKMITNKIKEILAGNNQKIVIGNVRVEKEWAFAQDIVEGIFTLVNQDVVFEAAVGTGVTHSIDAFLTECFKQSGLDMESYLEVKSDFKPEYPVLVSDPSTLFSLGWKPKTDLEQLVSILLK